MADPLRHRSDDPGHDGSRSYGVCRQCLASPRSVETAGLDVDALSRILEADRADGTMPVVGSHEWGLYAYRLIARASAVALFHDTTDETYNFCGTCGRKGHYAGDNKHDCGAPDEGRVSKAQYSGLCPRCGQKFEMHGGPLLSCPII